MRLSEKLDGLVIILRRKLPGPQISEGGGRVIIQALG